MNREFLESLGLEKEAIDKVMAEHGKAVQSAKPDDYDDLKSAKENLEQQVSALNATITETNEKYANHDTELSGLNAKLKDYETSNMKTKIALQYGIPYDLAGRLVGADEEALTKDAEKLAALVKQKEPIAPLKNVEPQIDADDTRSEYRQLLQKLNSKGE